MWFVTFFCLLFGALAGPNFAYYELLEIPKTASLSEIKKAYRKASMKYHPDKAAAGEKAKSEEIFRTITDAYGILTDPSKKAIYDIYGSDPHIDIDDMVEYHQHLERFRMKDLYIRLPFVNILYSKNFDHLVGKKSPVVWVITFSHPECGSCQRLAPIMSMLGEKEQEMAKAEGREIQVRVGAVNCAFDMRLCHRLGVNQYGVIHLFAPNQPGGGLFESEQYSGLSHSWQLLHTAARQAAIVPYAEFPSEKALRTHILQSKVLMKSSVVSGIDEIWLVDMWRPDCPPCIQVKASLRELAKKFQHSVKIATINCAETQCSARYFPYIQMWIKHKKDIRVSTINFDGNQHPASIAMNVIASVMNDLFDLKRIEAPASERRDEL